MNYIDIFKIKISQAKRLICLYLLLKKRKKFQKEDIDEEKFIPEFINFLDQDNYKENFIKVKEAISKGRVYQINLTQNFKFHSKMDSFELFKLLLSRQDTEFKAFIKDETREILSFSPELFFKTKKKKNIYKTYERHN